MTRIDLGPALSLLIFGALLAASSAAIADTGWYLGASWGGTSFNHGVEDFSDGSLGGGRVDDTDSGWKLYAGYQWTRHLALEAGYTILDNDYDGETTLFNSVSDGSGPRFAQGGVGVDLDEPRSLFATAVGILPLGKRTAFRAKAGVHSWETDLTIFDSDGIREVGESGTEPIVGLGVVHGLSRRWALRAEWERFLDIVDDDIDLFSLGVTVALGSRRP